MSKKQDLTFFLICPYNEKKCTKQCGVFAFNFSILLLFYIFCVLLQKEPFM